MAMSGSSGLFPPSGSNQKNHLGSSWLFPTLSPVPQPYLQEHEPCFCGCVFCVLMFSGAFSSPSSGLGIPPSQLTKQRCRLSGQTTKPTNTKLQRNAKGKGKIDAERQVLNFRTQKKMVLKCLAGFCMAFTHPYPSRPERQNLRSLSITGLSQKLEPSFKESRLVSFG